MNTLEQLGLALAFVQLCIGVGVVVSGSEIVKRLDTIKKNTDGTLTELRKRNIVLQDGKDVLRDEKEVLVDKVHLASTTAATRKRKTRRR